MPSLRKDKQTQTDRQAERKIMIDRQTKIEKKTDRQEERWLVGWLVQFYGWLVLLMFGCPGWLLL